MILPIFNKKDVIVKLFNGEVETDYEGYEPQNCEFSLTGDGLIFNTSQVIFPKCNGGKYEINSVKVFHKEKLVLEGQLNDAVIIGKMFQPIFAVGSITNQFLSPEVYNCSVCGTIVTVDHVNPPQFNCECKDAKVLAEMEAVASGKSSLAM